ncbi:MAG: class I SAM-dependent methyltransferase [Planctomycetota bacterium]
MPEGPPRPAEISWSDLNDRRRAVHRRGPRVHRLPLIPRSTRYAAQRIVPGSTVVDVGASEGRFGRRLPPGCDYRTVDVDPRVGADHRDLKELADGAADVVVCFETLEHLTLPEAVELLEQVRRVLRPGGRLYLSTPNVHHPWSYLRSATHRTPFAYDELGALLDRAGLEVEALLRCHKDSVLQGVIRLLARPLYRLLGVDFAKSILAVARRPPA